MSKIKIRPFDASNYLKDEADITAYLQAAMEDGDPALLAAALGDIARARGMTQLARDTGPIPGKPLQEPIGRTGTERRHAVQGHPRNGI